MKYGNVLKELIGRPIAYQRIYSKITGSITAGLLLSQLCYWQKIKDGEFYKTNEDIKDETGMTISEVKHAKKRVEKMPFVRTELKGMPRQTFYEIDFNIMFDYLKDYTDQHAGAKTASLKATNKLVGNLPAGEQDNDQQAGNNPTTLYTETTTENTSKTTTENVPPPPKNKPFIKNQKKETPLPPGFSEQLIEYLEEPGTPDFFWECIEEVVNWGKKKNVFIDWVSIDGFKRNRKAVASIFSKLRIAAGLDGTGDGLQKQVKIFLNKPDQWWYDNGISLEKLDKNFDSIYNSKNGKSKRDDKPEANEYKPLAEQSRKGRLLI